MPMRKHTADTPVRPIRRRQLSDAAYLELIVPRKERPGRVARLERDMANVPGFVPGYKGK